MIASTGPMFGDDSEERRKLAELRDHGRQRIDAAEFEALPTNDPGGIHVSWRKLVFGRWRVYYRGTSCGYTFNYFYEPIVSVRSA